MKLVHRRVIDIEIFDRGEELFLVKGTLKDLKGEPVYTYSMKRVGPGELFHGLRLEMTVRIPDMEIIEVEAFMDDVPGEPCLDVLPELKRLVGLRIEGGFQKAVNERLGGVKGCVHFNNLVGQMAQAVLQAYWGKKFSSLDGLSPADFREFINSCFVWDESKDVAKKFSGKM